ncbi:hypothetical protein WH7805_03322 [Synechococcus sp. WH 7805]|nr:hypothetical protein WH7805_03322 [Synechococcus sp. WH 7805]
MILQLQQRLHFLMNLPIQFARLHKQYLPRFQLLGQVQDPRIPALWQMIAEHMTNFF